ncbi:MAG: hypothetical protein GY810_15530 [Aureispira sp.]|nr:hypothetical protein [Aureispira sp.]
MADTQQQLKELYAKIAKWVEIYRANGGRKNPELKAQVAYFEEIKSSLLPMTQKAMKAQAAAPVREQGGGNKKIDAAKANESILDIKTNGSKSTTLYKPYKGVEASEKAAALHKKNVVKQKENLVNAGEKHGVAPAVLGAIMSRETGGGSALRSLKQFGLSKNDMIARIKKAISGNSAFDKETKEKYANLKASDLAGLDDNEKIWGDHGYGYGLMQFDVRYHPVKIIGFLGHKDPVARANAVIERSAELMAKNMADVRKNRPNWSEDEVLMTALAMYNGGADYRQKGHSGYMPDKFDLNKVDESTTGDDYAQDTIARAKKYAEGGDFDGDGSGGSNTNTNTNTDTPVVASDKLTGSVGKGCDNKDADVLLVQKRLNAHGASLTEDGKYGNNTLKAIEAFQQKTFGWADGAISANGKTAKALLEGGSSNNTEPTNTTTDTPVVASDKLTGSVGKGCDNKDADVLLVQKRLNVHGASLTEDGKYGNNTLKAIEAFQQKTFGWNDGEISANGKTAKALLAAPTGGTTTTDTNTDDTPTHNEAETWDSHTNRRVKTLDGRVKGAAIKFVNNVQSQLGLKIRVTSALRTVAEQDALFKKGGVTKARGGQSYHNYGLAIDIVEIAGGKALWSNPNWGKIAAVGKALGFEWGGDWKNFVDKPHFQMTFGKSIKDLIAAKYPDRYKLYYGGTPPTGGDDKPVVASSKLTGSVGKDCDNKDADVLLVQKRLNVHGASLTEDGKYGNNTLAAIEKFQEDTFGWNDGKISAGGKTETALHAAPSNNDTPNTTPTDDQPTGGGGYFSHPRANEVKLTMSSNAIALNSKAEALLKSLLAASGNFAATVTSTYRTLYHQARVMNKYYPTKKGLVDLYGSKAKSVADAREVVKGNGGSTEDIIQAMAKAIKDSGVLFSKHMSNKAIDISPGSFANRSKFYQVMDREIAVSGSGAAKLLEFQERGEKAVHIEFTFNVTG